MTAVAEPTQDTDTVSTMHVLDRTGDTEIKWDRNNAAEVQLAREHFDALKKKKFLTYRTKRDGSKGEIIHEFDPNAERIIAQPQNVGG